MEKGYEDEILVKLIDKNIQIESEVGEQDSDLVLQLIKTVLKSEQLNIGNIGTSKKINLFKILNSHCKTIFRRKRIDVKRIKQLKAMEIVGKVILNGEEGINEDTTTRVCVLFNNVLMTFFKHQECPGYTTFEFYQFLKEKALRSEYPYGMALVNNSLCQLMIKNGKTDKARKISSEGIKLCSRWLKSTQNDGKDKNRVRPIIKVLFNSLLIRAHLFLEEGEFEKNEKALVQAKTLVKKYCPDERGLIDKAEREIEVGCYRKQDTKTSKFSDYVEKAYQDSDIIGNCMGKSRGGKRIKVNLRKKKRIRSASSHVRGGYGVVKSRERRQNRGKASESNSRFRIKNNHNKSFGKSPTNSQGTSNHRQRDSISRPKMNSRKPRQRSHKRRVRSRGSKRRDTSLEFQSLQSRSIKNQSNLTFGKKKRYKYKQPGMHFNHTYSGAYQSPFYNPMLHQQYQENFMLQQKYTELQQLTNTLQMELMKTKTGHNNLDMNTEAGTDMRSSNLSRGLSIVDKEVMEKIGLIQKEQNHIKEVKKDISKKLDQINKKLDGDILPGIYSPSNNSNNQANNNLTAGKRNEKVDIFTTSNSPKSDVIMEESSIEDSSQISDSKNKSKNSSKNVKEKPKIKRKVSLCLGDRLRRPSGKPSNHQVSTYMISCDYLTTSYYVYLENCLQRMKKKSSQLKEIKEKKEKEGKSASGDQNLEIVKSYWTYGKLKERDMTVKYQYKVTITPDGFFLEILARQFDNPNTELGRLLCQEKLNENQIRFIFQKMKASEVLPIAYPISTFKSIGHFITFAMNHFITVEVKSENKGKSELVMQIDDSRDIPHSARTNTFLTTNEFNLVIKSEVISLLPEIEMSFMGVQSKIYFIHLNGNNFRVIIKSNDTNSKNVNSPILDIHMNDSCIRKHFEVTHSNEANQILRRFSKDMKNAAEIASKMSSKRRVFSKKSYYYNEDDKSKSKSKKNDSMVSKLGSIFASSAIDFAEPEAKLLSENMAIGCTGFRVITKNTTVLVDLVKKFVRAFNDYINFHKRSMKEVTSLEFYFLLKVIDHKKDHFAIYEAYESDLSQTFKLRARNTFESFSAKKASTLISEMAKYSPLAKEIKSSLGLEYKDQDILGKRFIWYVYMRRGQLVFHERPPDLMLNLLGDDGEQEETDEKNSEEGVETLQMTPLDIPTGKRFYQRVKDSHIIPITFEFIGLKGELFGIRASTYDPKAISQSSGFFVIFSTFKNHDGKTFGVKNRKKLWRAKLYQKTFEILHFYDKFGFKDLRRHVVEIRDNQPLIKKNRISGSYSSSFHSADYYFDMKKILKQFNLNPNLIDI